MTCETKEDPVGPRPLRNTRRACVAPHARADDTLARRSVPAWRPWLTWLREHASIMQLEPLSVSVKICLSVYLPSPVSREVEMVPP